MKMLKHPFHPLAFALLLVAMLDYGCSNDFDLTADWKEYPVVYGVLSPEDTAHYIRVEKAFLDPRNSALQVAQIPDSLYYGPNEIAVFLQQKGQAQRYQLSRVDAALEGYPRDSGIFAQVPNIAYKIRRNAIPGGLREGETYVLTIERTDGSGPDITAETIIPEGFDMAFPTPIIPSVVNFLPGKNTLFQWSHDRNTVLFSVTMRVAITESLTNGQTRNKTFVWRPVDNFLIREGSTNSSSQVDGLLFFSAIKNQLDETDATVTERRFNRATFILEGGGREIRELQLVNAANAGLAGAEILQNYSNISEGFGVFTAKNQRTYTDFRIEKATIDSLARHPLTTNLNFKFQ
jgi:hypothetical protein